MIEVKNLTKKYGDFTAVDNVSFTIEKGKIYGLLGPNGAGKSTTMNMITGCLSATSGTVTVNGHDILRSPERAKRCIGYLPEIPPLYTDMTLEEYLLFVAEAKGVRNERAERQVIEAMKLTGLSDVEGRLIRSLSKGYRQRVGIAQAMLGNPDVIILDEPTVGLDPKQQIELRDLIRRLGEYKTVILSSHILAEIQAVCDHIMIISHGRLVANGTIESLESEVNRNAAITVEIKGAFDSVVSLLESIPKVQRFIPIRGKRPDTVEARLEAAEGADPREDIFNACAERKMPLLRMEIETLTLEDIFLRLTSDAPSVGIGEDEADGSDGYGPASNENGKEEENV
ncbi:MAG: ABC transporter ATP-binding protein [Clostridia bacterium]|nr:ABC transporter ATP-binding protein [Clostridia bacterium]